MQPGGASQQLLGVDAVREFNVLRDSYGAEYGKRPGAQVLIVTQSGHQPVAWIALRIPAQQRLGRAQLLRRRFRSRLSSATSSAARWAARSRRTRPSSSPITKDFRQHLHQTGVDLVPDANARNGYLPCKLVTPGAEPLPGVGTGVRRRFAADQRVARAEPRRARFRRHFGGVQQSAANHPRRFRNGAARPHLLRQGLRSSAVYTIDDSADFTPTSTNAYSTDVESLREQVASIEETHMFLRRRCSTRRASAIRAPAISSPANRRRALRRPACPAS